MSMKIECEHDGHVTNVEAYQILQERRAVRDKSKTKQRRLLHADAVVDKAFKHLNKGPAATQQVDRVERCNKFLMGEDGESAAERADDLGLTFEERLQVLNLAPTGAVVVHLIVKNCEERFTDARVDEIVQLSNAHLRDLPPS